MLREELLHPFSYNGQRYIYSGLDHVIYRKSIDAERSSPPKEKWQPTVNISAIWLNVTDICNLSCLYCANSSKTDDHQGQRTRLMNEEVCRKAIIFLSRHWNSVVNFSRPRINFFGGEPLVNFELIKYAVYFATEWNRISGVPFAFALSTNGTLVNQRVVSFFAHHDIAVQLSLDGPQALHDRYRKYATGAGSYETILNNLPHLLNRSELRFVVRSTLLDGAFPMSQLIEFFQTLGVKRLDIKFASQNKNSQVSLNEDFVAGLSEDVEKSVTSILRAKSRGVYINPFEEHLQSLREKTWRPFLCAAGCRVLSIDPEGWIYPCHRFHGDPAFLISHVKEEFNPQISEVFAQLYTDNISSCQSCWAAKFCWGCCPAESLAFGQPLGHPNDTWCLAKKLEAEVSLKLAIAHGLFNP
jgi:uncharacterized protein